MKKWSGTTGVSSILYIISATLLATSERYWEARALSASRIRNIRRLLHGDLEPTEHIPLAQQQTTRRPRRGAR